jgi:acyl-CoA reductase-like NAD-dependent aldehyde dehydrogenase
MDSGFRIISPADGSVYFEGRFAADSEVDSAVAAARRAFDGWRRLTFEERSRQLDAFVSEVSARAGELAEMTAWQMGRPLAKADEVPAFRDMIAFYHSTIGQYADARELPGSDGERRFLTRVPYGVNLSICAWNFPVSMTAGLIVAPLLLGNVVLFKHSPQTARIGDVFNQAAASAGLPPGIFQALHMTNEQCGRLLGSGAIDLVNFIGSTRGGLEVRSSAAPAFVHQILELGGKDPSYVRADADLDIVVPELVWACFGNSGQSCCSVERIYVDERIHDAFAERFAAFADGISIGHPLHENAELGPVVNAAAAQRILRDVDDAISHGARRISETRRADGAYVAPTVLVDVNHEMRLMRDETFGPVAPIMKVSSDEEAVRLMNDSHYGLTASVWTSDLDRGVELGRLVDTGNFYVNRADYVDEYLPWGGVKSSGLGRADGLGWGDDLTRISGFYVRALAPSLRDGYD